MYLRCDIAAVDERIDFDIKSWRAHCSDGNIVSFNKFVRPGEIVFYSGYYEDDDSITVHGYIKPMENNL